MADIEKIKVVSYANLQQYDGLLKTYIGTEDAKAIKTVLWDSTNEKIKFFKKENATLEDTADYEVSVASSDVNTLKEQMTEVQGTLTGYSSTSTVKTAVEAAQKAADDAAQAVTDLADGQVKTNKEAIEAINDATTGIKAVAKKYTDDEVKKVTDSIGTVPSDKTVIGLIGEAQTAADNAQDDVDALELVVGDMENVKTTAKTVAGAVDELYDAIDNATEAGEVTLTTAESATEGYLKTYVLSQGGTEVGKIDIPKDLVVKSGEIVKNPEGQPEGTYIKLVIANDEETPIYIDVKDLVDIYKGAESATQVQITVDGYTISAALVAGGVGTTELADNAVTTAKVADKNITKDKLSESVQATLDKADAAEQAIEDAIAELDSTKSQTAGADGLALEVVEEDGIITSISGSIAANTYDAYGAASDVLGTAEDTSSTVTVYGVKALAESMDKYNIADEDDINSLFE